MARYRRRRSIRKHRRHRKLGVYISAKKLRAIGRRYRRY